MVFPLLSTETPGSPPYTTIASAGNTPAVVWPQTGRHIIYLYVKMWAIAKSRDSNKAKFCLSSEDILPH